MALLCLPTPDDDDFIGPRQPAPRPQPGHAAPLTFSSLLEWSLQPYRPGAFAPVRLYDQVPDLRAWLAGLRSIPPDQREERYRYLERQVGAWLAEENSRPALEARALLALDTIDREQLWREAFVLADAGRTQPFASFTDYAGAVARRWGRGESPTRLIHRRSAARLWLRLEAEGLPLPPVLSRLEALATRADGPELYRRWVEANGGDRAPSEAEIEAIVAEALGRESKLKKAQRRQAGAKEVFDRLVDYAEAKADPVLHALVEELQQRLKKKLPAADGEDALRGTKRTPPYDPARGCPFSFSETIDENSGEGVLAIDVAALPDPYPFQLGKGLARRKRDWCWRELPDHTFEIRIVLSRDPAEAQAQRFEAYSWALKLCHQIGAPLPEIPPHD